MMKTRIWILFVCLTLALSACNLPNAQQTATQDPNIVFTAAAQTVEAQLTQAAPQNTPTGLPQLPTATTGAPPTLPPTATSIPPTQPPTQECDKAQFIDDVTIEDGTEMDPNETFVKTWRLKNVGTCSWTTSYAVVFDHGDQMSGPSVQALTGNVNPGQTVDISVNLKAPASTGTTTGYWKLRNAAGVTFTQFYVTIKVVGGGGSSGFDLHSQAASAQWISCGDPCGGGTVLSFGGPDTDANGFVMFRNGATLEDGSTPSKVLETHPMWVDDGVISGLYPAYTVQAGEHFKAKIGFLGPCGAGNVVFQVNYKEAGTIHPLGSWTDSCNGSLSSVDVNLNSIAGHTVQFVLAVLANGSSGQDWAVWVSPRVEVP